MEDQILDADFRENSNPVKVEYVGFWPRVGASLVDVLVIIPIFILLFLNIFYLKSLPVDFLLGLLMLSYKPYFEYRYGGTLGKMALKIKVVDDRYEKIDVQTSLIRNFLYIASGVVGMYHSFLLFTNPVFQNLDSLEEYGMLDDVADPVGKFINVLMLIMALVVLFTRKKQGAHDLMANTYVIYKEKE